MADVEIQLKGVRKVYGKGEAAFEALKGIDLEVQKGEYIAITGGLVRVNLHSCMSLAV